MTCRELLLGRLVRPLLCGLPMALTCCHGPPDPEGDATARQGEQDRGPPVARLDLVQLLREDLATPRHPSDGGGQAILEETEPVVAGGTGSFSFVYTTGEHGIAKGGVIYLQVSPFWGWSAPQITRPQAPGFTTFAPPQAGGVVLKPSAPGENLIGFRVEGRALRAGEEVKITYGEGPAGAVVDRFAEARSYFWFAVDGDGDGVRALVDEPPWVEVLPGPPAMLAVTIPSTASPGDRVPLRVAALDRLGNAGCRIPLALRLHGSDGLLLEDELHLSPEDACQALTSVEVKEGGLHHVEAEGPGGLLGRSNPLIAAPGMPKVLWGDLHGHSDISDGTGTPAAWYSYARDVAGLDFAALTDHDHWGMRFLDSTPEAWREIQGAVEEAHRPGQFVSILGYEWTSWVHGHRHVLLFDGEVDICSSVDPGCESPGQLWASLDGRRAITILHHPAGGPMPGNQAVPPHPDFEPVVEIVSVHGCSEAPDCPGAIYSPAPGHFVQDALETGYKLGFVGGGDGHDGHPGLAHVSSRHGGLVAAIGAPATREGIYEALRARRVYATNGPRILLFTTLGGHHMGSTVPAGPPLDLQVMVVGTAEIQALELVQAGSPPVEIQLEGAPPTGRKQVSTPPGGYAYVRVRQVDGGMAWSSPFFFE